MPEDGVGEGSWDIDREGERRGAEFRQGWAAAGGSAGRTVAEANVADAGGAAGRRRALDLAFPGPRQAPLPTAHHGRVPGKPVRAAPHLGLKSREEAPQVSWRRTHRGVLLSPPPAQRSGAQHEDSASAGRTKAVAAPLLLKRLHLPPSFRVRWRRRRMRLSPAPSARGSGVATRVMRQPCALSAPAPHRTKEGGDDGGRRQSTRERAPEPNRAEPLREASTGRGERPARSPAGGLRGPPDTLARCLLESFLS